MRRAGQAPIKKAVLRKAVVVLAAAALLGALAGCGDDGPAGGGASAPAELSDIESSLNSIESEMGSDDAP